MLYYEGGYVENCPHGHGRLYQPDGTLKYEGEIRQGEMTGYGRSYSEDGRLLHVGYFLDEEPAEKDDEKPLAWDRPRYPGIRVPSTHTAG